MNHFVTGLRMKGIVKKRAENIFFPLNYFKLIQSGKTSEPKEGILRNTRRDAFEFPHFLCMMRNMIMIFFLKIVAEYNL